MGCSGVEERPTFRLRRPDSAWLVHDHKVMMVADVAGQDRVDREVSAPVLANELGGDVTRSVVAVVLDLALKG